MSWRSVGGCSAKRQDGKPSKGGELSRAATYHSDGEEEAQAEDDAVADALAESCCYHLGRFVMLPARVVLGECVWASCENPLVWQGPEILGLGARQRYMYLAPVLRKPRPTSGRRQHLNRRMSYGYRSLNYRNYPCPMCHRDKGTMAPHHERLPDWIPHVRRDRETRGWAVSSGSDWFSQRCLMFGYVPLRNLRQRFCTRQDVTDGRR